MNLGEKVKKAQKGDDNAFYELISEKKEVLYKLAYTYVKNKDDALDIIQETVYKAYMSIGKLKEPKFFNTYITRILINCALDLIKKNKNLVYTELLSENNLSTPLAMEKNLDLHDAIDKLNEKYKTIIILKYFQDFTLSEISEILQCPIGTVKTNLHKALKELRIQLYEEELIWWRIIS